MPAFKTIFGTALILLIIFAVLDFFNKTAYLLLPVTTVKGLISGKPDSTVATLNSAPSN